MNTGFCDIKISDLVKASWNYKEDNDFLMDKLVENIRRNGQIENIIVREIGNGKYEVVNGNHRLDALMVLKFDSVYCYNLGEISEIQAKRIAVETNETKFSANDKSLADVINEIVDNFDVKDVLETLPYSEMELDIMLGNMKEPDIEPEEAENPYTQKIESPIYEIKGENPAISELFDDKKTKNLVLDIENSEIDEEIKEFLRVAAQRHIVFNYSKIAEFYAHASKPVQELMEKSALVIIDFDKAIENGFVDIISEAEDMIKEDIESE